MFEFMSYLLPYLYILFCFLTQLKSALVVCLIETKFMFLR